MLFRVNIGDPCRVCLIMSKLCDDVKRTLVAWMWLPVLFELRYCTRMRYLVNVQCAAPRFSSHGVLIPFIRLRRGIPCRSGPYYQDARKVSHYYRMSNGVWHLNPLVSEPKIQDFVKYYFAGGFAIRLYGTKPSKRCLKVDHEPKGWCFCRIFPRDEWNKIQKRFYDCE